MRVVAQHPLGDVTGDVLDRLFAHLRLFRQAGNGVMAEVVGAQPGHTGGLAQAAPGRPPVVHRLRRLIRPALNPAREQVVIRSKHSLYLVPENRALEQANKVVQDNLGSTTSAEILPQIPLGPALA